MDGWSLGASKPPRGRCQLCPLPGDSGAPQVDDSSSPFLSTGLCFQGDLLKGDSCEFTASKVERAGLCVCSPGEGVVLCRDRFSMILEPSW